jgi:hypothetical protein
MPTDIPSHLDNLQQCKGLIDLDGNSEGFFGLGEYVLEKLLDDIILIEYVDEVTDGAGSVIERNGLFVPTNTLMKAWRKGKVLIAGPNVRYCKINDIVIFPNDKGASVANIDIKLVNGEVYKIKKGMFLNEQRIFGVCSESKKSATNANRKRRTKNTTTK